MKMRIEHYISIFAIILYSTISRKVGMQHSYFAISTNFLAKEQSAKGKLKDGTHCPLQWTPFGIPLGETPGETQTFFLLTFLKRCHDSYPVTRFFRNGICSFLCSKSVKIRSRSVLLFSESLWGLISIFLSFLRRRTMVEWSTLKSSAQILVVKFSSSSTAAKSA